MELSNRIQSILPLSPLQEGMLFHHLLEKESQAYHEQIEIRLSGKLDLKDLESCFQRAVEQSDALRSVFLYEKIEKPRQIILKKRRVSICCKDLRREKEDAKEDLIRKVKETDLEDKFDLTKDVLIRFYVNRIEEQKYHLLISFHHIIMDGWSVGLFLSALFKGYLGKETQVSFERKQPALKDYSDWLLKQDREEAICFWKQYLAEFENVSTIMGLEAPGKKASFKSHSFSVSKEQQSAICDYIRKQGLTINTFFKSVWSVILQQYNQTDDVVFGSVVSGRNVDVANIENMVGLFINTLPVRCKVTSQSAFTDLMKEIQVNAMEQEKYGYLPLAEIQQQSVLKNKLLNHILVFENYPMDQELKSLFQGKSSDGLFVENISVFEQTNYPFTMVIIPGEEFKIQFIYNENCFDTTTVERIEHHLRFTIQQVLDNQDIKISDFTLVTDEEKQLICDVFNRTARDYPKEKTVHELFVEIAEQYPEQTAVIMEHETLTYQELDEKSNVLAHQLRRCGVKPDDIVAVMMPKSIDFIVSILAIIKAGAAYLPIDTRLPEKRMQDMLEDANVKILIRQKEGQSNIKFNKIVEVFYRNLTELTGKVNNQNHSEDLVNLIYTSGSTGKPKGVMVTHRGVVRLCKNPDYININNGDNLLMLATVAFDASTFEIWTALLNGAKLVIISQESLLDIGQLKRVIFEHKISIALFTTPLFHQLVDLDVDVFRPLQQLIIGGDVLSKAHTQRVKEEMPHLELINAYGPTENSVISTIYPIKHVNSKYIPIGKPIANSSAYILDPKHSLCPIGVTGELWVGGAGVARGYMNNQALTDKSFLPSPFRGGERLYRTGDLASWLPDGNIEFKGRMDNQVKIRGYRIEIAEVELSIKNIKGIQNCYVQVCTTRENQKYLCAFICAKKDINIDSIKIDLRKELPVYCIPEYFIQIEKLPLKLNGKVDQSKLPNPVFPGNRDSGIPPGSAKERQIAEVWKKALGMQVIYAGDDFFKLGGNSLSAIKVLGQLSQVFDVTLQDIFTFSRLVDLANAIDFKANAIEARIKSVVSGYERERAPKTDTEFKANTRTYKNWLQKTEKKKSNNKLHSHILLTGGTGFLGSYLLKTIMSERNVEITCIIRATNANEARERLQQRLIFYFGQQEAEKFLSRCHVLGGDLSKPLLGLKKDVYENLKLKVDCVLNTAAYVKHFGNYQDFLNVNVKGVENLIEFISQGLTKELHHISTISVGTSVMTDENKFYFSEQIKDLPSDTNNPYVRSKIEGEKILFDAIRNGMYCKIYRVGNLVGDSETGIFQENIANNAFYQMLRAFVKLGIIPDLTDQLFDFSFINSVAEAIVKLMHHQSDDSDVYHVMHPCKMSCSQLGDFINTAGLEVRTESIKEFGEALIKAKDTGKIEWVQRLLLYGYFLEQPQIRFFIPKTDFTDQILKKCEFFWPDLTKERFDRLIRHCQNVSFI